MSMEQTDSELPFVIESSRDSVTKMVGQPCGHCDYDRTIVTIHRLASTHRRECPVCEWYSDNGSKWKAPTTHRDEYENMRQHADEGDSITHVGSTRGGLGGGKTDVFQRKSGSIELFQTFGDSMEHHYYGKNTFTAIVKLLEEKQGWLTDFVDDHLNGKQIRPAVSYNPNATHIGRMGKWNQSIVRILTRVDHMDLNPIVVHIPPTYDGVAI